MTKIINKNTGKTEEVQSYGFGFINAKGEFIHRKNAVFCLGQAIGRLKDDRNTNNNRTSKRDDSICRS